MVYPGQVIWEGTNISEGRGTTLPFELVGAPFWRCDDILERLAATPLSGCILRPLVFEPTSGKWAQTACPATTPTAATTCGACRRQRRTTTAP